MAQRRILVIDDEEDSREFVVAVLEEEGVEILTARDGESGLKLALEEQPDLIILDVQMPNKDGFTVFTELKQEEATKAIPVIMLTGMAETSGIRFSKSIMGDFIGVEPRAYVEKPVNPETLTATVEEILGGEGAA
ncbi:MAG: response regulator [Candidatus Brocadiae bacterium]|nr:response regulator [Candidatus Brocadiia bacterium]